MRVAIVLYLILYRVKCRVARGDAVCIATVVVFRSYYKRVEEITLPKLNILYFNMRRGSTEICIFVEYRQTLEESEEDELKMYV